MSFVRRLTDQHGQGIVDYSILMAMVTITVVLTFTLLAPQITTLAETAVDEEAPAEGRNQVTNAMDVDIPCEDRIVGNPGKGKGKGKGKGSGGGSPTCDGGSGSGGGSGVGGGGGGGGGSGGGGGVGGGSP